MSIDSGQNLIFDAGFPLPNVDQSSQQFRDNFSIIKTATERLQSMHSDNASVVALTASMVGTDVVLNATYKDGGLVLPAGNPGTALTGMIRYDSASGTIQFYNGGWRSVVAKDGAGLVTLSTLTVTTKLTLSYSPTASTDAVPKSYVDTWVATLQGVDSVEHAARIASDANLQQQIDNTFVNQQALDDVMNAVVRAENTANTAATNANAALVVANEAEADLDAAFDASNTALATANAVSNALTQEIGNRIQGDLDLANSIANGDYALANSIQAVSGTANAAFGTANAVSGTTNAAFGTANSAFSTANAAYDAANTAASASGPAFAQANTALATASAAFATANAAVKKSGDTMSGALVINAPLTTNGNDVNFNSGNLNVGGNITASGDITAFSDVSLKYNIATIENALDLVDKMRGATFTRADVVGNPEQVGVIAQEMQEVLPQVVHEQPNGLLSVAYGNLTAVLIEAVKELRAELNEIKSRLP